MLELIKRNEPIQASAEITVSVSPGRQEAGALAGSSVAVWWGGREDWVSLAIGLVFFLLSQLPLLPGPLLCIYLFIPIDFQRPPAPGPLAAGECKSDKYCPSSRELPVKGESPGLPAGGADLKDKPSLDAASVARPPARRALGWADGEAGPSAAPRGLAVASSPRRARAPLYERWGQGRAGVAPLFRQQRCEGWI